MQQLELIFNEHYISFALHNKLVQILYYVGAFEENQIEKYSQESQKGKVCRKDLPYLSEVIKKANCDSISDKINSKNQCDSYVILNEFYFCDIHRTHDWFIYTTQERLFVRNGERWDAGIPPWMKEYEGPLMKLVMEMGLTAEIKPSHITYDAAAVFGATALEIEKRILYLQEKLLAQELVIRNRIYLLTGERYVNTTESGLKRDKGAAYLEDLSYKINKDLCDITEADIMQDLGHSILERNFDPSSIVIVNALKSENRGRPTTVTTLQKFIELCNEEDKNILFVSRAPNIPPQREDTIKIMSMFNPHVKYEVIGNGMDITKIDNNASIVHTVLMPLAGSFYSGYDRVSDNLEYRFNKEVLHEEL